MPTQIYFIFSSFTKSTTMHSMLSYYNYVGTTIIYIRVNMRCKGFITCICMYYFHLSVVSLIILFHSHSLRVHWAESSGRAQRDIIVALVHLINPRRACAGGLLYLSCVSVSVMTFSATSFVSTLKSRYVGVDYRLFLIFNSWILDKPFDPFRSNMARKSQYANKQLPLTTRFSPFQVPCIHQ